MGNETVRCHPAARRVEERSANLARREALPRHLQRRQMPVGGTRHTDGRISGLMTRRAWKSNCTFVFGAPAHQHDVPMAIFALARVIRRRMTIQTPSILKDRRETQK